jgi:hypothetical protein
MDLNFEDIVLLLHPAIAVTVVFPLIGIVVRMAWQTRARRLEVKAGNKSKISPASGQEHLQLGRWLTGAVVGIYFLGITFPIFEQIHKESQALAISWKFRQAGRKARFTNATLINYRLHTKPAHRSRPRNRCARRKP